MNKLTLTILGAILLLQCSSFQDRYDRIEPSVIRPIGFVYDPYAEGAPGDTIHLHAYFAGDTVVSSTWQLSYDFLQAATGNGDTVLNYAPLPIFGVTGNLPDSMDFFFVIPDTTFYLTQAIPQQSLSALKASLPAGMGSMTQQSLAGFLRSLGAVNLNDTPAVLTFLQVWGPTLGIAASSPAALDSLGAIAEKVVSVFSVQGVILANVTAKDGSQLQVRGQFTIRYNSHFRNTPLDTIIPVAQNPVMHWVGVYAIKNNSVTGFAPGDSILAGRYTPQYLYNDLSPVAISDTILIDTGYTYFFGADSGIYPAVQNGTTVIDTTRDKLFYADSKTGRDTFQLATWFYDWEYEDDLDSVTLPEDSLLLLVPGSSGGGGGEESYMQFLPSLDTKMTAAHIWATVYDSYLGQLNFPVGFAIRDFDVYFKYTAAYLANHGRTSGQAGMVRGAIRAKGRL
jgi:hypothetical protein